MRDLNTIHIRQAEIADVENIASCIAFALNHFDEMPKSKSLFSKEALVSHINHQEIKYFVAELKQSLVGMIAYKQPTHIFHFFVHPNLQFQGVGTHLFNYVLDQLTQTEIQQITVNAHIGAVHFYKKLGFTSQNEVDIFEDLKFIRMKKMIE
ncbi:GNAT family N-acetyltransferase [Acinetobacter sp. Ver3]|uniref:GNAT family N-acetyltransferase n=1 Tax=Acinetobacter sp. Ver3 TaxID=466088 RepID=UPI00044A92A0|nr:GNAT family N-acetyltransferase [Acinetobacter sp. Ver3]EZQ10405.1 hypothetical protein CL42_07505 [Acinetobacter sp. Ver3]